MSLVVLIVLTLLGISAMDSTKLQTRMAANTKTSNCAFQVANTGLDYVYMQYKSNDPNGGKTIGEKLKDFELKLDKEPYISPSNDVPGKAKIDLIGQIDGDNGKTNNFLVQSTGSCDNDPNYKVILIEGWRKEGLGDDPNELNVKLYLDPPPSCNDGLFDSICQGDIDTLCQNAMTLPICEADEDPEKNSCVVETGELSVSEEEKATDCSEQFKEKLDPANA